MESRKIKIKSFASKQAEIEKKYGIGTTLDKVIEYELLVPDTAETLKSLSSDPDVLDWSDSAETRDEGDITVKEITSVNLLKESLRKKLSFIDLSDMKTVIRLCLGLREVLEFSSDWSYSPETLVDRALAAKWDTSQCPSLSEDIVKVILKGMSVGKKEFGDNLLEALIKTAAGPAGDVVCLTDEGFLQTIFIDNYGKK